MSVSDHDEEVIRQNEQKRGRYALSAQNASGANQGCRSYKDRFFPEAVLFYP